MEYIYEGDGAEITSYTHLMPALPRSLDNSLPQPDPEVLATLLALPDEVRALNREKLRRYIEEGVVDSGIVEIVERSKVSAAALYLALSEGRVLPVSAARAGVNYPNS